MKPWWTFAIMVILVFMTPVATFAWSDWQTLKTDHFTVFYKMGQEAEAWQVLATVEHYRPEGEALAGNEGFHVAIVIDDAGTYMNGFANPTANQIHFLKYRPQGGWAGIENWWSFLGVHEYTHILTISKTGGVPKSISAMIGNSQLFFPLPNDLSPEWILEGIAVFNESQISPYQGRLNDGLFDAYIGARVKDARFPSILDTTYAPSEFQLDGIYTFGGEFMNYLAKTYGQDRLTQFFAVNGSKMGSITPFPAIGIDQSAQKVFGKSFPELWTEWQNFETKRFQNFKMEGKQLTQTGWEISDLKQYNGKLYYQRQYPVKTGAFKSYVFNEIRERNPVTNTERVIVSTTASFTLPMQIKNGFLYYVTDETRSGYANTFMQSIGHYALIHQLNLETGKERVLLGDEIRAFTVLNEGQILYSKDQKAGFGSELYTFLPVTKAKKLLFATIYLIDEIASDSKRIIIAARLDWQNLSIYQLNLENREFVPLIKTPYIQNRLSLQGEKLFFTANYQKTYGSYCYDFETGRTYQLTENGFAANPVYNESDQQLYFIGLNSYGYDLYRKPAEFKEFTLPTAPATLAPTFDLDKAKVTKGSYLDNLKAMTPSFHTPIVNIDNTHNEYGIYLEGQDAIGDFPSYSASLTYDTKIQKWNSSFDLKVNYFAPFDASISYIDQDQTSLKFNLSYPFVTSCSPGLANLTVGTSLEYEDDYQSPAFEPFVTIGFQYPTTHANLNISTPMAQLKDGSKRFGLYTGIGINQYLPGSELTLNMQSINDPENSDLVFPLIRGYNTKLTAKQGKIYSLEYSRPLIKIRNGFWNPNVYFEDLTLTLFSDQALPALGPGQASWGIELHLETKTMYIGLPLDWGARFSRNIEGDTQIGIFAKVAL